MEFIKEAKRWQKLAGIIKEDINEPLPDEKAVPDSEIPDEVIPDDEEEPEDAPTPEIPTGVITKDEAKQLMKDTKGKFFTVTFIKRTDGTKRVMNCRLGVKAYLKGGDLPFNPEAKQLLPVYDIGSKGYRLISLDSVIHLKIGNNEYEVR
jgi:hypothetical protein